MSVPDTNTFTLQDVVDEVIPTTNDLQSCFNDADDAGFDPAYSGSKNSLYNFRNYGVVGLGYGYLYNWEAVSDSNFLPAGCSIPTDAEWTILERYLSENGFNYDGTSNDGSQTNAESRLKIAKAMCSGEGWAYGGSTCAVGNTDGYTAYIDKSGLGIMLIGQRIDNGTFSPDTTIETTVWSSTLSWGNYVFGRNFRYLNCEVGRYEFAYKNGGYAAKVMYSGSASTVTDYNGNIYDVVQIGNQQWLRQNWKCEHLNDGTLIPNVTDNTEWSNLTTMGRCAYNNDESNV